MLSGSGARGTAARMPDSEGDWPRLLAAFEDLVSVAMVVLPGLTPCTLGDLSEPATQGRHHAH